MVPKGSEPANTIFDWQADAYDAAVLGGIVDGVDVISTDYVNEASHRAKLHGQNAEIPESVPGLGSGAECV